MGALGILMLRRGTMANPVGGSDYILSEDRGDPEVFRILMEKGVSSDGVGITKDDAAKVTSLGTWFKESSIETFEELKFFVNVKKIDENAFRDCKKLRKIDLTNVTTLSVCCFFGADLSEYDLDMPNAQYISGAAAWSQWFMNSNLRSIKDTGLLSSFPGTSQGGAMYGCFASSGIQSAYLNGNVRTLGPSCFAKCEKLQFITIEEGLENIQIDAFTRCTALKKVDFPSSLKTIADYAMPNMTSLESLVFKGSTPPAFNGSHILTDSTSGLTIYVPDTAVDAYKTANNFSQYADIIKPLSEYNG